MTEPEYTQKYQHDSVFPFLPTLLSCIALGLRKVGRADVWCIEVELYDSHDESLLVTDLPTVLGYLANDIHWNEQSDWRRAARAEVRTI